MSLRLRANVVNVAKISGVLAIGLLLASAGCSQVDFGKTDDISRLEWRGPAGTAAVAAVLTVDEDVKHGSGTTALIHCANTAQTVYGDDRAVTGSAAPAIRQPAHDMTPYYGSLLQLPDEALFWPTSTQ